MTHALYFSPRRGMSVFGLLLAVTALPLGSTSALAQPASAVQEDLPPGARMSPMEAANVHELRALQSQGQLDALRHAQVDRLAVDLWRLSRGNMYYASLTEPGGLVRRALKTDDERTAWLSFDELRRQAQRIIQAGAAAPSDGRTVGPGAGGAVRAGATAGGSPAAPTASASSASGMPAGEAEGNAAQFEEVARWQAAGALTAVRRADLGNYSVRLQRHDASGVLVVTLQQRDHPWRLVRTRNLVRAQKLFDEFQKRAVDLAAEDARRDELAAQAEAATRELSEARQQARQLASELDEERRFQQQVTQQRQQSQAALSELQQRSGALQEQLAAERRRVNELRRQLEAEPAASSPAPSRKTN